MPKLTYAGTAVPLNDGETVLDALLRAGHAIPNACRAGACQSCMVKAEPASRAALPAQCQSGLRETMKEQGYLLACQCKPESDLALSGAAEPVPATIVALEDLGAAVLRVRLEPERPLEHRAGQYLTLLRADGLARSYSIVSRPEDGPLELHVRRYPNGRMSGWLASEARPGTRVAVQGPGGACFYSEGRKEQPLLLVGTGTGLAPLVGIARDALARGHTGAIRLYHGARTPEGLYFRRELADLAERHPQVTVQACVLDCAAPAAVEANVLTGALDKRVLERESAGLKQARIFLCGDPTFVTGLRKALFLAGANYKDIFADAFLPSVS